MSNTYDQIVNYYFGNTVDMIIKNGAKLDKNHLIDRLSPLKRILLSINDKSFGEIIDLIAYKYYLEMDDIITCKKLTSGIASSISLNNGLGITSYLGSINTNHDSLKIDENTYFDIASMTKFLTILFIIDQYRQNKIDIYRRVNQINPNFTISKRLIDILRFNYEIKTDNRIDKKNETGDFVYDKYQAIKLLQNPTITSNTFTYSDIPYMIASLIIPNFERKINTFIKSLGLSQTLFNPSNIKTTGGQIGQQNIVNDPKARVIGGVSGHAGLFSTSSDLVKLFDFIQTIEPKLIREMIKIRDYSNKQSHSNRMGAVYLKHPFGLDVSEVPKEAGYRSFATAGFTGGWAIYDLSNKYTANFLSNPLSNEAGIKDQHFARLTNPLKEEMVYTAFKLLITRNVLSRYYSEKEINQTYVKRLWSVYNK